MTTIEAPVLIVGGGPVGLALAVELGWRGVACVLAEQEGAEVRKNHPRMDNVGIRTMEFARRWGIVEAIEHAGFPRDLPLSIVYATSLLGPELAREPLPAKAEAQAPSFSPQKHELCPQNFFDPVMQAAAASYAGARLLYGHRLTDFADRGDRVEATLQPCEGGDPVLVRAQYLTGCDGAGSFVAGRLGLTPSVDRLLSCSTNIFIRCPEIRMRTADRRAYRHILLGEEGVWGTFVNIDGRDVWRLQLLGDDAWPQWSDAEIDAFIRRGIGADLPYELISWVPWSRRERVADRFRVGRCFLVGDAAHQLSPTGGYGMNTGIAEAVDLGWKVSAVLAGWGGEALLDSYEAERRPVAARNVKQASDNLAAMRSVPPEPHLLEMTPRGAAARARSGSFVSHAMQREWRSFGIHLGAIYRDSPVIAPDGPGRPDDDIAAFVQRADPGARAPHAWLSGGRSTLDLFGHGFVLLDFRDAAGGWEPLTAAARAAGLPLEHVRIDDSAVAELYERACVLVRPDGYIAWRGDAPPADAGALVSLVRGARRGPISAAPSVAETAGS